MRFLNEGSQVQIYDTNLSKKRGVMKSKVHPYSNCDCQEGYIEGFYAERDFAKEILNQCLGDEKGLVVFELSKHPSYFYGHSNFKILPESPSNWKFIRSFDEIIQHQLFQRLLQMKGDPLCHEDLQTIIFLDEKLKKRFETTLATKQFKERFRLAIKENELWSI